MVVSHKRLLKLIIDKDMKKSDLEREDKITHYALSNFLKERTVSTEILGKFCETLDCTIDDIKKFVAYEDELRLSEGKKANQSRNRTHNVCLVGVCCIHLSWVARKTLNLPFQTCEFGKGDFFI